MSRRDTMRDPRYAGVLLEIERKLHEADLLAVARGLTLTDSNIRSLLVRAINEAKGDPVPVADWIASLEAIKDSCSVRTGREPGSKGYLDFVSEFLKNKMGAS